MPKEVEIKIDKKLLLRMLGLPPIDVWTEKPQKGQLSLTPENYLKWLKRQKARR